MGEHPIKGLMESTMQNIKEMVDVNTIVGETITTPDGTSIIPISKVTFGFGSGGSEFAKGTGPQHPFGGGSGAGISIVPYAFLVIQNGNVKLMQVNDNSGTADKIIEAIPDVIEKITSVLKKNKS